MREATNRRHEEIRILHAAGKNDVEIALEIGVSHATVGRYRRRLGLPRNGHTERRPKEKAKKADVPSGSVCDDYCLGCTHLTEVHWGGVTKACYYRINTGKKRPCPAGKDCTEKEIGTRKPRLIDPW